jgi:hypothetical protein
MTPRLLEYSKLHTPLYPLERGKVFSAWAPVLITAMTATERHGREVGGYLTYNPTTRKFINFSTEGSEYSMEPHMGTAMRDYIEANSLVYIGGFHTHKEETLREVEPSTEDWDDLYHHRAGNFSETEYRFPFLDIILGRLAPGQWRYLLMQNSLEGIGYHFADHPFAETIDETLIRTPSSSEQDYREKHLIPQVEYHLLAGETGAISYTMKPKTVTLVSMAQTNRLFDFTLYQAGEDTETSTWIEQNFKG